jgi:hypothetical protein
MLSLADAPIPRDGVPVRAMAGDMWHTVILTQHAARRNPLRESFHTVCLTFATNRPGGEFAPPPKGRPAFLALL